MKTISMTNSYIQSIKYDASNDLPNEFKSGENKIEIKIDSNWAANICIKHNKSANNIHVVYYIVLNWVNNLYF